MSQQALKKRLEAARSVAEARVILFAILTVICLCLVHHGQGGQLVLLVTYAIRFMAISCFAIMLHEAMRIAVLKEVIHEIDHPTAEEPPPPGKDDPDEL